ncbi:MAG: hemolysin family protein [Spirochaetota bacterium]|nr:hemolysin family protein [Spirochaetota bacterium]
MIPLIIAILIVLLVSALCSMVEAALFSVPINRVRTMVAEGYRFSSSLLKIKENIRHPIATVVILNNISNIVGSLVVGGMMAELFDKLWVGIVSGVFTFLIIVVSEIIPKTIGERHDAAIALISSKPLLFLTKLFNPIVFLLGWVTKPLVGSNNLPSVSEEEIKMMASLGTREGVLEKEEEAIIRKALLLNDIKVKEIMTPRMKVFGLDEDQTLNDIKDELLSCSFSRIPLFQGSVDQITGLLYKSDALVYICSNQLDIPLSRLRKKVLFVPESKPIDKLMENLRITQSHTAIVMDEYGGTSGLVTLEDILEELVGDIAGEDDIFEARYVVISQNEILAPGFTLVDEVNEFFDTSFENHRTIGKLILERLNRFPELNESIHCAEGLTFIVEELTERTIERVRIKRMDDKLVGQSIEEE